MGQSLPGACKLRSIATMVFGLVSEWNAMKRTFTVVSPNFRYQPLSDLQGRRSGVQRYPPYDSKSQLIPEVTLNLA